MSMNIRHFSLPPLFFFNAPATTEIYTLSLHDALPISAAGAPDTGRGARDQHVQRPGDRGARNFGRRDRKSTRLNSSHMSISYAVFCLKKKKKNTYNSYITYIFVCY